MEQTDEERPSSGPTRVGFEVTKNVGSRMASILGDDKHADQDGNDTSEGPENSHGLFSIVSNSKS